MRIFGSRQARMFPSIILAAFAANLVASAEAVPSESVAEAAPDYLGLELPLRPGELVVPTADRDCSVIVFAPNEARYERFAAYWSTARWEGYCRFGLAHGKGKITGVDGNWSVETAMLYGLEVNPAEAISTEIGKNGALTWDQSRDTLNFFSGAAFSDLKSKRYVIQLEREPAGELELGDLVSGWYGDDYLEMHTFNDDGRQTTMSVSTWNVDTYCGLGLPPEFKPHEKEVKKACKKTGDKLVVFRREGLESDPWASRPITWLKSCPFNKARNINECGKLVDEALGDEASEVETLLTVGDAAAREAAKQEILDRYAQLEATVEEPLLVDEYESP